MDVTRHRNLFMFGEICGDNYAVNVLLLATMWDLADSIEAVENREHHDSPWCHHWSLLYQRTTWS